MFDDLGIIGTPWTTVLGSASLFQKPLVAGTLVGLILGHPTEGVIIGAAIQLPYIAFISAGGTIPSDPGLAGVLGTAFAIVGHVDPATAITIAIPFGLLGTVVWVLHMTIDVAFVHMADKAAEQGDLKKVCFLHVVPPQIVAFAISVIPVMLGAYFGADYMARLVAMLSNDVLHVLQVIGGVLPALGVAMNLRSISRPEQHGVLHDWLHLERVSRFGYDRHRRAGLHHRLVLHPAAERERLGGNDYGTE